MKLLNIMLIAAFLLFGVGDAVTAAWMIKLHGPEAEVNILFRSLVEEGGILLFVSFKIGVTALLLIIVKRLSELNNEANRWMFVAWLGATAIGGLLACTSNLSTVLNFNFINSEIILMIYIVLSMSSILAGNQINKIVKT